MSFRNFVLNKVYGTRCPVYLFFVVAGLCFFAARPVFAGENPSYAEELVQAAHDARLSQDRYWDILLHYKRNGDRVRSLIADPRFFLAPDGKMNPAAELDATIRGFFQNVAGDEEPTRCKFIARYTWLKERLRIDESRMPPLECKKLNEALANISMKSAVLVFPAAHGNGPASMFGHTLIRIDSGFKNDLLSHAVNFAAKAEDNNGFIYAFKGIFGMYKGYYSILPYYEKVKEYNSIEHRDMWEYSLNLTEDEIRRMVYHIWELKDAYSDYYFFDENCSFDLLFLLESARPSARLTDAFWDRPTFWVIPIDTIRVIKDQGLVAEVKYRPSQATRILALASTMTGGEQKTAVAVVEQKKAPESIAAMNAPDGEKKKMLDLSAELLQYRYSSRQLEKEDYLKRFLPILRVRSELGGTGEAAVPVARPVPPEEGHLPGTISAAAGYQTDVDFADLEWRPAYHDLLDPDDGYVEGAAINFFDVRARYFFGQERDRLRLQSLHFFDITSLAPRDEFFRPVSWKVLTGFDQEIVRGGEEQLIYRVNPGGGVTYKLKGLGFSYFMLESDIELCNAFRDRFSFGIGPSAGILTTINDFWKVHLAARGLFYELGEKHRSVRVSLDQNFRITTNNSLRLSLSREKTFDQYQTQGSLSWIRYL